MWNDALKVKWLYDLGEPKAPGKYFSRYGHPVVVSETTFRAAQAHLAAGAQDILFEARRVDGHYVLETLLAIM